MQPQQPPLDPEGLEAYFTDVEHLRDVFKNAVAAPTLTKRLLVIHGVGGVGKSSLLRIFRLHCKSVRVPVALASGDEAKSAVDVLSNWADDLKADGIKLPMFGKTVDHYRAIQAKVDEQARKTQQGKAAEALSKAAGKTIIDAAASTIPVLGPLVSALGGAGAEALADWLRGFLSKPDIDLLLDPAKKLGDDFLTDVAGVASKRRLVLMLDTFEQMTASDDWARDLAQRMHPNVLLIIAGRAVPNWSRQWPGWMAQAQVEELRPMSEDDMRTLVQRYYATMRGGEPNPAQVEAIIRFARGLPIVVTSAVRLWVQYGVEDFQAVKPQVVADLVDRLMEGVPKEMAPALEAAAAVRWFNKEILRVVTGLENVNIMYDELRRFPFVRPRVEGFMLHDAVREILDENLRVQDPERHHKLHEQAAAHYEAQLEKTTGDERERYMLERLYHRVCADEETGVHLFCKIAEELVRYWRWQAGRLRTLLQDVNTYPLERENGRLWRDYYNARLAHVEARYTEANISYEELANNHRAEPRLRAYALCDLGRALTTWERLRQLDMLDRTKQMLEQSLSLVPLDDHLANSLSSLARIFGYEGEWDKSIAYLEKARQFYAEHNNEHGLAIIYGQLKRLYHLQGNWKAMFTAHASALDALPNLTEYPSLKTSLLGDWSLGWILAGRYSQCEQNLRDSLSVNKHLAYDTRAISNRLRYLGLVLGMQGKYDEATAHFTEGLEIARELGSHYRSGTGSAMGIWGRILIRQGHFERAGDYLTQCLAIKEEVKDSFDLRWALDWLGNLHETQQDLSKALDRYNRSLELRWTGGHYFECSALTGLVRAKHALGDYAAIPPLLNEAEQLAQQYEYNDHLASLRLTQGHIAWDGHIPEWGTGFDAALRFYQHALIFALRYNRFLLDEVLWGGGVATPLRPIIPHCKERGEESRRMLTALRDWWQTGINDIGTPRPDSISPIPESIPLLEAERIAREREPGDGSPQRTVVEQVEEALGSGDTVHAARLS